MKKNLKLAFLGPQGSGKGTQAKILVKKYGYTLLGMGVMLREVAEQDSDLGRQVNEIIDNGDLVPNDITFDILKKYLDKLESDHGFIIDGFPRNLGQAEVLDTLLALDAVVEFHISEEESLDRTLYRATCPAGHTYNSKTKPPKVEGKCDIDGQELKKRDDDNLESLRKRLQIFTTQTKGVIEHYKKQGRLIVVNGEQSIDNVTLELEEKLSEL